MARQKLWDKGNPIDQKIEVFTIGKDRELDLELAKFDVLGSLAHVQMLSEIGVISKSELPKIRTGLIHILNEIEHGNFSIEEGIEDVHSQVEMLLTSAIGPVAGKIHTGRSRNDQVLLDLKLFYRSKLNDIIHKLGHLSLKFLEVAEIHKDILMPGYTHTQVAMTSSFGMWFSAFGEAFLEDAQFLNAIFPIINKNPLGSAAGYGSSFPLNRTRTTALLGFESMHLNPINAQYGRGKAELIMAQGMANTALTINKLATDMILYSNENYRFLSLPPELTTGSSIMPHKKNPDVFELIRAHTNFILNAPNQISMLITNLTTGYHRDFQLLKEVCFPLFHKVDELLDILSHTLSRIKVNKQILGDEKYQYLLSVDAVNELVKNGMPFREAYVKIGQDIENNKFEKPQQIDHSHEGSIGNLCLDKMTEQVNLLLRNNNYSRIKDTLSKLTAN